MFKAKITGVGRYLPSKVLTNHDLEKLVETNDEWITTRTGIKERHIAEEGETTSMMGAKAAEIAIERSGVKKEDIDMVLFATFTPDMPMPASACLAQDILKIPNAGTLDVQAACTGFIYALGTANAYVASGMARNVLVIAAETLTRFLDWKDRTSCVLFGDGAGAVVVSRAEAGDKSELIGFKLGGDGQYANLLYVEAGGSKKPASCETVDQGGHFIKMAGNSVFKVAVKTMADILAELMVVHNIKPEEVKLLIPHQANLRIITAVAERINFPMERTFVNIDRYANTSAATIPIALDEAAEQGRIKRGDIVAFVAFGGGLTWGAGLMRY